MNEELDYAEMLEIPVSTVNVVKKKSIFKRRQPKVESPAPEQQDELKDMVVESVNERVGAYVYAEDVSDPPAPEKTKKLSLKGKDKAGIVLISEAVAIGVIALAIFLTNVFMPQSAINTFLGLFKTSSEVAEPTYNEFVLSPVVSELSDAEIQMSESGVISFTAEGSVYPVCKGKISKIYEDSGMYTVEIAHTSTFTSVITGLTDVYPAEGTQVLANIPVGYSDGNSEVRVSMYDGSSLLNCFTMMDEVPVWKS
ncbi:MAG: hypothetical protein K2K60_05460 [Clostridia bacterium]|nr:hypothetical protein [Clostridia bacterium]